MVLLLVVEVGLLFLVVAVVVEVDRLLLLEVVEAGEEDLQSLRVVVVGLLPWGTTTLLFPASSSWRPTWLQGFLLARHRRNRCRRLRPA